MLRKVGVAHREAFDMGLVNDCLVERCGRAMVDTPVEVRIVDDAFGDMWGAIQLAAGLRVVNVVTKARRIPIDPAVDRFGIRVEQELVRIAEEPAGGIPRTFHPVAIALAGADVGEVTVPDISIDLLERDTRLLATFIDETEKYLFCDFGEQREVGTRPVIGCTERIRVARPYFNSFRH
jgi:hypothetical protein